MKLRMIRPIHVSLVTRHASIMARLTANQLRNLLRRLLPMTVQAETHVKVVRIGVVRLGDIAVTAFAGNARREMRPMIEVDKVGLIEDPDPLHRLLRLPLLEQFVDVGLIFGVFGRDGGVTTHALVERRQPGGLSTRRAGMAIDTLDAGSHVFAVLIGQWLRGGSQHFGEEDRAGDGQ